MQDIQAGLTRWGLDLRQVRERLYRAPTPRERERWHALWLLAQGWSAAKVAEFLERGPAGLSFEQSGGSPPPSGPRRKAG